MVKRDFLYLFSVLFIIFFCYTPSLQNQFTNWDDDVHLTNLLSVRSLDLPNIRKIFTESVFKVYIPLTTLSFAVEYHFFKLDPFIYHLNNLLLHLGVSALVFWFIRLLGFTHVAAFWGALLFGVHPMHVESVAWITERKDVLYSMFFMAALCFYVKYVITTERSYFFWTIPLGILSMLAKPMALSLPLVMLLLDWYMKRKWAYKLIFEKAVHLIYIVPLAWITFHQNTNVLAQSQSAADSLLVGILTFTFYIEKFLFPFILTPVYIFPENISVFAVPYLKALVIFMVFIYLIYRFHKSRIILFAVLFYILNIFYLLRFSAIGYYSWVADRFMYVPSIGFCLLFGIIVHELMEIAKKISKSWIVIIPVSILIIFLMGKTYHQIKIWYNSETLWTQVIKHYPDNDDAYVSRGGFYNDQGKYELAIADFSQAIAINSRFKEAFNNRGLSYLRLKQYDAALNDFNQAIALDHQFAPGYHNRSEIYKIRGQLDKALQECTQAILLKPDYKEALNDRAIIYLTMKNYEQALKEFDQLIEKFPNYKQAYNNRGVLFKDINQYDKAFTDFNKALQLDPNYANALTNRGIIYAIKGKAPEAMADFKHALRIKPSLKEAKVNLEALKRN